MTGSGEVACRVLMHVSGDEGYYEEMSGLNRAWVQKFFHEQIYDTYCGLIVGVVMRIDFRVGCS